MTEPDEKVFRSCPHCGSTLQVTEELLQQAEGMLRCGSCLNIFDGYHEELHFIAPQLPDENLQAPLGQISVTAMSTAELPPEPDPTPWKTTLLGIALALGLLGQIVWQQMLPDPERSISLDKLVIRPHPEKENALRVDAILNNRSHAAQRFPLLFLNFRNKYGTQQAQRSFTPEEYLHGEFSDESLIPARSSIQVSLTLVDPGPGASGYSARLLHQD